jgi:hypothetical protein
VSILMCVDSHVCRFSCVSILMCFSLCASQHSRPRYDTTSCCMVQAMERMGS